MSSIEKERPRGANHGAARTPTNRQERRSQVLEATTQTIPLDATHLCRSMARHLGTTQSFVSRVWRAHGMKPHLIRTIKLSNEPRFEEKLRDVVGLYLDPLHNAGWLSYDERRQIQALDPTQPGLPMKKGRCKTMTHDYKRHGTTTLFAAVIVATGEVIGKTYRKHRHHEVLRFLREVEEAVPRNRRFTSFWTITRRTSTRRCSQVLNARSASSCNSSRPARRGPTSWSGSSPCSRRSRFAVACSPRCLNWRSVCAITCSGTTKAHALWSGRKRLTKSLRKFTGVARLCQNV